MKKRTIEIPHTLDIDKLLLEQPPANKLIKDRLLYLIHLVYYTPVLNPDNAINTKTKLNSQILKRLIGKNYKDYVDYLIFVKIINRGKHFVPGVTSYHYEMGNINLNAVHHKTVKIEDETLLDRLETTEKEYYTISTNVKKNYKHLKKWFNDKLTANIPEDIVPRHKYQLENINLNRYRMSIDEFGKRLHTNLTNMPKDLRKHLKYNGNHLVEIDIKNSQFYLVIKLLVDYIKSDNPVIYDNLIRLERDTDKIEFLKKYKKYHDIALYTKDATSSDFYENIGNRFFEEYNTSLTRDDVKKYLFEAIFSKSTYKSKLKSLFIDMYPSVHHILDQKKKINKLKEDKHKALSKTLQQMESSLVLRTICKNNQLNNIPIFTIHDAILTTENNIDVVYNISKETLFNHILFQPNIKINRYS